MPIPLKDERVGKTISIKESLLKQAIKAASDEDMSLSRWICRLIREKLAAGIVHGRAER